ncbi:MAG: hypothetical protein IJX26_01515 [Clostridia bacterium]|nr:hypothetical protein [Clostridia bacterium]
MAIKNKIKAFIKKILNKSGLKTNRQIIVFESDDWGAIRNSSAEAVEQLKKEFPDMLINNYTTLDCLESNDDINELKKVLLSHNDSKGNHAKFTLNFATANPNFNKIKENNYKTFYHERIDETYQNTPHSENVLDEVKDGINLGVFQPQLHSREHINSQFLIDDLQNNAKVKRAFNLKIVGVTNENYSGLDSLNCSKNETNEKHLTEAMKYFVDLFGFTPTTYIAPCYVWNKDDEIILKNLGVKALQGKIFQNIPITRNNYKKKFHKFGSVSKSSKLKYLYRNCFFEPSKSRLDGNSEDQIINNIMREIEFAFNCKKPAIICTHRVNYTSGISIENRNLNLKLLNSLIEKIKEKYTKVEFMSTDELYEELLNDRNKKI